MRKTEGSPLPFGAAAKERKVNFSVQVPMGKTCELLLYREGNTKPEVCFDMPEEEGIGEVPVSYTHLTLPTKRIV